ncbi:uncharacterized protein DNG_08255 [Cephalotrichum gorgonifer]|uniref:Zn(2)-C6 fungal-type domain-containing protein n=1 Tax=Cephalotrichum gorgonifer TaxID=2041049 RepID=A0AAE8N5B2_9PEZI|nr:uncharacterized protein DNG_08255 [Cephalotrichum gorgonifer]
MPETLHIGMESFVRCDKRKDTCGNCARLRLTCSLPLSFPNPAEDETTGLAKPRRLRGVRACLACRQKKVRCSGDTPQCTHCGRSGRTCTYPELKRPIKGRETATESSASSPTLSPDESRESIVVRHDATPTPRTGITQDMLSLVDNFFELIYPLPSYAFLHPETTKKRCRDGQFHIALAFALCAVAAQHTGYDRDQASRWVQSAEQSIWQHLECPTVPRLQTLLLIIHHRMESGRFERAFMLTAMAARFAAAMRLNHEHPELDPIAREVRRRIVWSLKIVERYFAHGLAQFELCPTESIYLEFPLPEEKFSAENSAEYGAYSLTVRLESVRRDIMKLTRSLVSLDEPLPSLTDLIRHHQQALDEIGAMMPNGTQLSPDEIPELLLSPWLPRRILMHISWHGAHFDLYRILLPGYPEAAPSPVLKATHPDNLASAELACLHHSSAIIQLLTTLNQQSTSHHLFEFDTAICVYQSVRMLLFISRFGRCPQRPTPEFAASRVDLCIAALKRFFPSSRLVSPIIEELERLQKSFSQQLQLLRRQSAQRRRTGASMSPPPDPAMMGGGDPEQEKKFGMEARERLAIHSLLRRAGFSNGDDDGDDDARPERVEGDVAEVPVGDTMEVAVADIPAAGCPPGVLPDGTLPAGDYSPSTIGAETSHSVHAGFGMDGVAWDTVGAFVGDDGDGFGDGEGVQVPLFPWFGRQEDWDLVFGPQAGPFHP